MDFIASCIQYLKNRSGERHCAVKEHCLWRKERLSWDRYSGPGGLLGYEVCGYCVEGGVFLKLDRFGS